MILATAGTGDVGSRLDGNSFEMKRRLQRQPGYGCPEPYALLASIKIAINWKNWALRKEDV